AATPVRLAPAAQRGRAARVIRWPPRWRAAPCRCHRRPAPPPAGRRPTSQPGPLPGRARGAARRGGRSPSVRRERRGPPGKSWLTVFAARVNRLWHPRSARLDAVCAVPIHAGAGTHHKCDHAKTQPDHNDAEMLLEGTVLYEQFADARRIAVELTDHYNEIPRNDPTKAEAWDRVV